MSTTCWRKEFAHFGEIIEHESEIESRSVAADCTIDSLKTDNTSIMEGFQHVGEPVVLIDSNYEQTIEKLIDGQIRLDENRIRQIGIWQGASIWNCQKYLKKNQKDGDSEAIRLFGIT